MDHLFLTRPELTKSGAVFIAVIPIIVTYVLEPLVDIASCQNIKKLQRHQVNIKDQTEFQRANWFLIISLSSFCLQDETLWDNFLYWSLYAFKYEVMSRIKVKWISTLSAILATEICFVCIKT